MGGGSQRMGRGQGEDVTIEANGGSSGHQKRTQRRWPTIFKMRFVGDDFSSFFMVSLFAGERSLKEIYFCFAFFFPVCRAAGQ